MFMVERQIFLIWDIIILGDNKSYCKYTVMEIISSEVESRPILNQIPPAVEITTKNYSLEPDMMSGWRPNTRIVGPVPLNFDNPVVDTIVEELIGFCSKHKERIIYLGLRPLSTYKMHEEIQHQYKFKHAHLYTSGYPQLAAFFRKFYSNFQSKTTRIFRGMNPTVDIDELKFDAGFQGGNLDAAIKVGPNQYDLFMRIDSNTIGHLQWFNFRVFTAKKRRIKFNICNFKKNKTLYQRGMKPYVQRYSPQGSDWVQGGLNVKFQKTQLRYQFLDETFFTEKYTFNCLSFQYQFEDGEQVGFAYSPPFNYSEVLRMNRRLVEGRKSVIKEGVLCESLAGLQIPLLTISDFQSEFRKKCVLVSGRVHPGEANSSHCLNGLIEFLCSDAEEARTLRQKTVFKIIPMINPDGVVLGNFRTSIAGKDLNRVFKTNQDVLYPEVKALKNLVNKLKNQYGNRFQFFLDFHGHSVKKNVFIYGPQYALGDNNYYRTRMLPKLISTRTEMFRYYSCLFRISSYKRSTARAVVLRQVPHCYTIQASNSGFYSVLEKKNIDFGIPKWKEMGKEIGLSICDYIEHAEEEENLFREKRKRLKDMKNKRRYKRPQSHEDKKHKGGFREKVRLPSVNSINDSPLRNHNEGEGKMLPDKTKDLIERIKQDDENHRREQSDDFSEGGSDSESQDDLSNDKLSELHQKIVNYLDEFQGKMYKKKVKSTRLKVEQEHSGHKQTKIKQKLKPIELVPSLRKRAELSIIELKRMSINKGELFSAGLQTHAPYISYNSQKGSSVQNQKVLSKSLAKTHMSSDMSSIFIKSKQINLDKQYLF